MAEGLLPPVVATLVANVTDFKAKMAEARGEMATTADTGGGAFSKIKDALGSIPGPAKVAGLAIAGIAIDGIRHFEESTAAVRKFQRGVGDSAEDASKWVYAAQSMGIEADGLATSMVRFGRNVAEHSDKFAQWNVTVAKAKDGTTDLTGTLLNVSDAFKSMHDPAQRDAMVMDLLGRQGAALIPVLQRGRDGLKEFFKEAGAHGLVFDDKQLQQGRDFTLAMHNLGEAAKGLEIQLASGLVPILTTFAQKAATVVDEVNHLTKPLGGIAGLAKDTIAGMNPLAGAFEFFGGKSKKAGDDQEEMAAKVKLATVAIVAGNDDAVKAMDKSVVEAAKQKIAHDGLVTSVVDAYSRMGFAARNYAQETNTTEGKSDADLKKMAETAGKVADAYTGLGPVADAWGAQVLTNGDLSIDEMGKVATAAQKLRDGMASSFDSATSVVSAFADKASVSAGDINKFFKDQVKAAQDWSTNMQALARAGIDHGLFEQLAEAGPKTAPAVAAILDDVRRGNLGVINQAQTDLNNIFNNMTSMALGYQTAFWEAGSSDGEAYANGLLQQLSNLQVQAAAATAAVAQNVAHAVQAGKPVQLIGVNFDEGGWVPGPSGAPVPATVHAGEFVLSRDMLAGRTPIPAGVGVAMGGSSVPVGMRSGPTSVTIIVSGAGDPAAVARAVKVEFEKFNRNNSGS